METYPRAWSFFVPVLLLSTYAVPNQFRALKAEISALREELGRR